MSTIARRDLLMALAALGGAAVVATPAWAAPSAVLDGVDAAGAAKIGKAYLAAHPASATALTRRLLPNGAGPAALARLKAAVAADFRQGRVFVYRGWRLSDTEGALMALLSLSPAN